MIEALLAIALVGIGFIAFMQWRSQTDGDPRLKAEIERKNQEIGELKNQITESKSEKDKLSGQGKELYDRYKSLESELKATTKERDAHAARLTKYETQEEQKLKKHEDMVTKLEEAKTALEDEKVRIRREDEEREQRELEKRDRMWKEHEENVIALLNELTKKEHCQFIAYSNENIPQELSGRLKPDFAIDFLGQYVVFDAKVSRSQDLQNYINESVKKTAEKYKGNQKIYSTVFFVVPTDAISQLKTLFFYEEGCKFFIVSPESLEPILASYKRIEEYEITEAMDPQERENIVDLIAAFHFHISARNAHELVVMKHGIDTLSKAEQLHPDLLAKALVKKAKMRNLTLNTGELKDFTNDPNQVAKELLELLEPKSKISKEDIKTD